MCEILSVNCVLFFELRFNRIIIVLGLMRDVIIVLCSYLILYRLFFFFGGRINGFNCYNGMIMFLVFCMCVVSYLLLSCFFDV